MCTFKLLNHHLSATTCSFATGIVHWAPPEQALEAATRLAQSAVSYQYGPAAGLPALMEALRHKLAVENGLFEVRPLALAFLCTSACLRQILTG